MKQRKVTKTGGGRRVTKSRRMNPVHEEGSADPVQDEYADLVRSAATGDAEALDRLLMRAQEVAWRFSTSVCGHADDAEDAMQEALIKTYRYVGRIREPEAFRPWLYRTVRNACLMGRRKRVGEPARLQSLDEVLPGPRWSDAPGRAASREESGTTGGQRRAPSSPAKGAAHVAGPLPRDRVPSRDGRLVDARGREGDGDFRGQRQDAPASGSSPAPGGLGERREMTVPTRPSARCRTLLLELSRYLDGDLTPARRRAVERHIKTCACCGTMAARLRRTVAACRAEGKTAAAPRRDVARGGADQGAGGARGATAGRNRSTSAQRERPPLT